MIEREVGAHTESEVGVVVKQTLEVNDRTFVDVTISEQGLRQFAVDRAVDLGIFSRGSAEYNQAIETVNRRVHLMDVDPFAYITWFSNQDKLVSTKVKLKEKALRWFAGSNTFKAHNCTYMENCTGENHIFVNYGLWKERKNRVPAYSRNLLDKKSLIKLTVDDVKSIYRHEVEHVVQFCFQPDVVRNSRKILRTLWAADIMSRAAILFSAALLCQKVTGIDQKMFIQMVSATVMLANSVLPVNPVTFYAGNFITPGEIAAYKRTFWLDNNPDEGLNIQVRKLDVDPVNTN